VGGVEVLRRQGDLVEVVGADHAVGCLAHLLHGGQQEADQERDDGDHHQQFDQSKAASPRHC
jgi:hypothetical protein